MAETIRANTVNIIVTAEDKTAEGFRSVKSNMGSIASSAKGTLTQGLKVAGAAFAGLSVAGVAGMAGLSAGIVKLTLDASKVEGTISTFNALAESVGSTGPEAMEKLRDATRGMVADAELAQAGNKFLAMGIAETADEAAKLSEISTQLGMAMGEDRSEERL